MHMVDIEFIANEYYSTPLHFFSCASCNNQLSDDSIEIINCSCEAKYHIDCAEKNKICALCKKNMLEYETLPALLQKKETRIIESIDNIIDSIDKKLIQIAEEPCNGYATGLYQGLLSSYGWLGYISGRGKEVNTYNKNNKFDTDAACSGPTVLVLELIGYNLLFPGHGLGIVLGKFYGLNALTFCLGKLVNWSKPNDKPNHLQKILISSENNFQHK